MGETADGGRAASRRLWDEIRGRSVIRSTSLLLSRDGLFCNSSDKLCSGIPGVQALNEEPSVVNYAQPIRLVAQEVEDLFAQVSHSVKQDNVLHVLEQTVIDPQVWGRTIAQQQSSPRGQCLEVTRPHD